MSKDSTTSDTAPKTRAPRTLSPFRGATNVSVKVHIDSGLDPSAVSPTGLGEMFTETFGSAYAVRCVSRTRTVAKGKSANAPATLSVYIAPTGFKFPATLEHGVRLDAETAGLLKTLAASMGLDPNDPKSIVAVAKALATKAGAAK